MGRRKTTIAERFWRFVDKRGPDECWNWIGSTSGGYGRLVIGTKPITRIGAHRISYLMHYGVLQSALDVLHTCDNPSCVNPRHLKLGTPLENMIDMCKKGRSSAKLTPQDAALVKRMLLDGYSQKVIADKYGIGQSMVSWINRGHSWDWVAPAEAGY